MSPIAPTVRRVKSERYVSLRLKSEYFTPNPNHSMRYGESAWSTTVSQTMRNIDTNTMDIPIVGVPSFFLWSLANSVAAHISASVRIVLPSLYRQRSRINGGMSASVTTKDTKIQSVRKARLVIARRLRVTIYRTRWVAKKSTRYEIWALCSYGRDASTKCVFLPKYTRERYWGRSRVGGTSCRYHHRCHRDIRLRHWLHTLKGFENHYLLFATLRLHLQPLSRSDPLPRIGLLVPRGELSLNLVFFHAPLLCVGNLLILPYLYSLFLARKPTLLFTRSQKSPSTFTTHAIFEHIQ